MWFLAPKDLSRSLLSYLTKQALSVLGQWFQSVQHLFLLGLVLSLFVVVLESRSRANAIRRAVVNFCTLVFLLLSDLIIAIVHIARCIEADPHMRSIVLYFLSLLEQLTQKAQVTLMLSWRAVVALFWVLKWLVLDASDELRAILF